MRSLERCAPRTRFAEICAAFAERLEKYERTEVLANHADAIYQHTLLLVGNAVDHVRQVWRVSDEIESLQAEEAALGGSNHRLMRVLRSAPVPLWVLAVLRDTPRSHILSLTAEQLLELAGLDGPSFRFKRVTREDALTEATAVLDLLRILAVLGLEPSSWNEFLRGLAARLEHADHIQASRVEEVPVPPRPCRPPGELVTAAPRVPRAPGHVVPRCSTGRGRTQLRCLGRRGGRGGRPTALL